jgi:hypothetical protein
MALTVAIATVFRVQSDTANDIRRDRAEVKATLSLGLAMPNAQIGRIYGASAVLNR